MLIKLADSPLQGPKTFATIDTSFLENLRFPYNIGKISGLNLAFSH
jgi:hypothetical protein